MTNLKYTVLTMFFVPTLVLGQVDSETVRTIQLGTNPEFSTRELPKPNLKQYKKWRQKGRIHVGESHLSKLTLTDDEQFMIVMSEAEATVRVYEHKTRKLVGNYPVAGFHKNRFERGDITVWPGTGTPQYLVGNSAGMNTYDGLSGDFLQVLNDLQPWQMAWSKDRTVLICSVSDISTQSSGLTFFQLADDGSMLMKGTLPFDDRVDSFALSSDNRHLAVTLYPSNRIEWIDLQTGETTWSIEVPQYTNSVDISPDNKLIAVGGERLILVDAKDPTKQSVYTNFNNNIHKVVFSPSGDAIAVSSYDGRIRILAADISKKKARLLKTLRHAGTANVYSIVFKQDGKGLVSSSGDQTIRYWGKRKR